MSYAPYRGNGYPPPPGLDDNYRPGAGSGRNPQWRANDRNGGDSRDSRDSRFGRDDRRVRDYEYRDYEHRDRSSQYPPRRRDRSRSPPYQPRFSGGDTRPPQGDFTFRVEKPAGVRELPPQPHQGDHSQNNGRRRDRGGPNRGRGGSGRPARGGRGPWRPFVPADRPMLQVNETNTTTVHDFVEDDTGVTYKALDDLSDSDEAEMDISDNEDEDQSGPSKKRPRLATQSSASGQAVPKWSNPDPYDVLPPTETQAGKKKDVVQLIRKARVLPQKSITALVEEQADFISFDDSDGDEDHSANSVVDGSGRGKRDAPPAAPRDPKAGTKQQTAGAAASASGPQNPANSANSSLPDKPIMASHAQPSKPPELNPSRKRNHKDEIKPKLPQHAKLGRPGAMPMEGFIASDWRVAKHEDPTPWLKDHSDELSVGVWLHKEILDFYDYVKPTPWEHRIRTDLVKSLNQLISKRFKGAEVHPFGSYMTGLYLPTGDMDLVMCSRSGLPKFRGSSHLHRFRHFLVSNGLAHNEHGQIEVISQAKVPLVKYIDSHTGLKVDLSFENTTGITAIDTFAEWKEKHPAMPILVTLIKHFLTMRGLNEPVNGGIGGFTVICLVVSMLQMRPAYQSRDMNAMHHLGELLMDFFDLYGNKFNYESTAIRMNPPGYIHKSDVNTFIYKNPDRLSIIDPNDPQNDISGGSRNFPNIANVFAKAHRALAERVAALAAMPEPKSSLLSVILEGNYSTFRLQREHLGKVYANTYG